MAPLQLQRPESMAVQQANAHPMRQMTSMLVMHGFRNVLDAKLHSLLAFPIRW